MRHMARETVQESRNVPIHDAWQRGDGTDANYGRHYQSNALAIRHSLDRLHWLDLHPFLSHNEIHT